MKQILIAVLAAVGLMSCGKSDRYVIDGHIAGLDEYVYLYDDTDTPIDSAYAEKGIFKFKGTAPAPSAKRLATANTSQRSFGVMLYIEPGKIVVKGDLAKGEITTGGTPANDANNAYIQEANRLMAYARNPDCTPEERAAIDEKLTAIGHKFLSENQDNLFGATVLARQLVYEMRPSELLETIAGFPESLQQTEMLQQVKTLAQEKQRTEVGQPYIDIVQNTPEGTPVSLQKVIEKPANKYILVDFWASWCKPCMAEVPYLLEAYKDFHSKGFEIYGVSFDTDHEKWTATIKGRDMNWIHVSDLNRFNNTAARDYSVNSIPSNFLVDCATGKIVAVKLRGAELEQKLTELLP